MQKIVKNFFNIKCYLKLYDILDLGDGLSQQYYSITIAKVTMPSLLCFRCMVPPCKRII